MVFYSVNIYVYEIPHGKNLKTGYTALTYLQNNLEIRGGEDLFRQD